MTYRYRATSPTTITEEIGVSPRRTPTLRLPAVPPAARVAPHPAQARAARRKAQQTVPASAPPARPPADFTPLPSPTWAPTPRRSRPGRGPLTGRAAEVGRYLQRHLDERRDDELTARVVLDHLIEGGLVSVPTPAQAVRLSEAVSVVRSLRQAGAEHLAAIDAPCPGPERCGERVADGPAGPQDEMCEAHWIALGGWFAVQAVHVRELLRLGGAATS